MGCESFRERNSCEDDGSCEGYEGYGGWVWVAAVVLRAMRG